MARLQLPEIDEELILKFGINDEWWLHSQFKLAGFNDLLIHSIAAEIKQT